MSRSPPPLIREANRLPLWSLYIHILPYNIPFHNPFRKDSRSFPSIHYKSNLLQKNKLLSQKNYDRSLCSNGLFNFHSIILQNLQYNGQNKAAKTYSRSHNNALKFMTKAQPQHRKKHDRHSHQVNTHQRRKCQIRRRDINEQSQYKPEKKQRDGNILCRLQFSLFVQSYMKENKQNQGITTPYIKQQRISVYP